MNRALSFILALAVVLPGSLQKANTTSQAQEGKTHLVHFVVINMSGAAREVHHRRDTVPLPVAVRVPLQVPAGDSMEITSNTDKVEDVIAIAATDEGRTIPIQ